MPSIRDRMQHAMFLKPIGFCLLGILLVLLLYWLITFYFHHLAKPSALRPPLLRENGRLIIPEQSPLRQFIKTQVIKEELIITPFALPAIVEADPATLINVLPPLLGRITRLNKNLGDPVAANEILFTLDSPELAQALSDLERAKSTLIFTQENLKRQQQLSNSNIAARRELQQAQNEETQALSEVQRASARLKALKVEESDHLLIVRSPRSGRVIELHAAEGTYWTDTAAPIMTVADLSQIYITASAQEKDLQLIDLGQTVDVALDAYSQTLHSKVQYIGALLDPDTRTVPIRMRFENQKGLLKPNMFGKATFLSPPHLGIILPLTTIIQRGFDSLVFVEVAPWQFEPRLLKLGCQLQDKIEVLSGLKVNERVVTQGGIILND